MKIIRILALARYVSFIFCQKMIIYHNIETSNKIQLGSGAIPCIFYALTSVNDDDHSDDTVEAKSPEICCENCKILQSERNQLSQTLSKTQIDFDFELEKKNIEINELKCKLEDKSLIIKSLKEQNKAMNDAMNKIETQNGKLRANNLQSCVSSQDAVKKEIIDCLMNGQQAMHKYSPNVREFALNLHYI